MLARVRTGEADAARAAIAAHWPAARQPVRARPGGTHLARLQVLTPPARRLRGRRRTPAEHVLLAADVDAPPPPGSSACAPPPPGRSTPSSATAPSTPAPREPAAFARWVAANRLEVGFSVIGSPGATSAEVRAALDLRAEIGAFAEAGQGARPTALRAAWRAWRAA